MDTVVFKGKTYTVDSDGFLTDPKQWDDDFAEAMAPSVKLAAGLTREHWDVIHAVRTLYKELKRCPLVHETCRKTNLYLKELETLFPTGYLRGACKLAGITYKEGYISLSYEIAGRSMIPFTTKIYEVDVRGFLVRPEQWDEQFAVYKAHEMKMPELLTDAHWKVIQFLRSTFERTRLVPTVFETCKAQGFDIEDLERLFPDGYHRGAVKIAGLRVR